MVEHASQDVEAFYALLQHHGASNDTDASEMLLVGSLDATGVLVRKEAHAPPLPPASRPSPAGLAAEARSHLACAPALQDRRMVVQQLDIPALKIGVHGLVGGCPQPALRVSSPWSSGVQVVDTEEGKNFD